MKVEQRLSSGLVIPRDARQAVRFIMFETGVALAINPQTVVRLRPCLDGSDMPRTATGPACKDRANGETGSRHPVLAKGKTDTGRCWVYVRDDRPFAGPAPPAAMFYYSRDRSGEHLQGHLAGYAGPTPLPATTDCTRPTANRARWLRQRVGCTRPAVFCHGRCRRRRAPQGRGQDHQRDLAAGAGGDRKQPVRIDRRPETRQNPTATGTPQPGKIAGISSQKCQKRFSRRPLMPSRTPRKQARKVGPGALTNSATRISHQQNRKR
jgi:hypothetical protein